ncbi:alpha/beta hydrolase [Micromonospora olivasterospora]|uniref:Alpha-beta hydrolase superfamily lysophospholipase n=1 Tax=Micromonospora olivasterospora TaxID=1880 RepID=A0A562I4I4_MICOL|nr:alpha/beta fold hydrolase [Micromonospora olivasterospora]TWH65910.1 alpha-beta hydrolase superfamily lysophospholipase [Micromonospora olivasterospora]
MNTTPKGRVDTIVLLHGLWMTPRSWENWAERYRSRGFRVLTPAWPGMDREVEALREDPGPIASLTMDQIIDHYAAIIERLPTPPIVMGHSFGGLFAQVLLDRGLGAVAVGVHPAPIKGVVRLPVSTLRAAYPVLRSPRNRHRAVPITPEEFRYAFGNTLSAEDSDRAWQRYAVPAAGHVLFEGAFANLNPDSAAGVDNGNDERGPLLLIGSDLDHVVPAAVVKAVAGLYQKSRAITYYHGFPGRSHFTVGEPGWEQVADYALDWSVEMANTRAPAIVGEAPHW